MEELVGSSSIDSEISIYCRNAGLLVQLQNACVLLFDAPSISSISFIPSSTRRKCTTVPMCGQFSILPQLPCLA